VRTAHVRTTSNRVANTLLRVFTASCHKSKLSPRCRTIILRLWLIAENFKATLAVRSGSVPDLPQYKSKSIYKSAFGYKSGSAYKS
jgi:hypothetical protein